jgi:hypothetical protein
MTIMVVKNEEQKTVIVYIPRCSKCQKSMFKLNSMIAPPPDAGYADSDPANQYMLVGMFSFFCQVHPWEIEKLNRDQLSVINEYPTSRQFYKQTDLYNRKMRRKKQKGY